MSTLASGRRITIHDVAARAGVSQPTASLVLGRHPKARVAALTRERVLAAAVELGYQPNVVARSLARRRSFALGIIVPDLRNPFVADVVAGAERVAVDAGYAVLLCNQTGRGVAQHLETLLSRQIDGVLLDAAGAASLPAEALAGVNVVLIDEPSAVWPGIATDAFAAGHMAAEHLLGLGHRALGFLGPAIDTHAFRQRERGFVTRLREAGISIPSERWRRASGTFAGGRDAMRALLQQRPRVTAVFCANDLMAIGALKQSLTAGVRIPAELSVMGCDDIEMARLVTPELTTIAVPAREVGARAARLLLQLIEDSASRVRGVRPLPVRLMVRGSTAVAPEFPSSGIDSVRH